MIRQNLIKAQGTEIVIHRFFRIVGCAGPTTIARIARRERTGWQRAVSTSSLVWEGSRPEPSGLDLRPGLISQLRVFATAATTVRRSDAHGPPSEPFSPAGGLQAAGIGRYTTAPPLYRLLWRMGVETPPPHFASLGSIALLMGLFFGMSWGLVSGFWFGARTMCQLPSRWSRRCWPACSSV
jgi:Family of unknown function (DUF6404)